MSHLSTWMRYALLLSLLLIIKLTINAQQAAGTNVDTIPENNLRIIIEDNTLTVHILAPIPTDSFSEITLKVVTNQDSTDEMSMQDGFDMLVLAPPMMEAHTCFIYQRADVESISPPPRACNEDATFSTLVATVDVFWYDNEREQRRDVIVMDAGVVNIGVCPGDLIPCDLYFESEYVSVVMPEPLVPPTDGKCLLATAAYNEVMLRPTPSLEAATMVTISPAQLYDVHRKAYDSNGRVWYQVIQTGARGWVAGWVTRLGGDCSHLPVGLPENNEGAEVALLENAQCLINTFENMDVNVRLTPSLEGRIISVLRGELNYVSSWRTQDEDGEIWYLVDTLRGYVAASATQQTSVCDELPL